MTEILKTALPAIEQLYRRVLDENQWTQALRALQETLGSDCFCVVTGDDHTGHIVQHTSRGASLDSGDRLVPACSVAAKAKLNSRGTRQDPLQQYHWHCEPDRCSYCLGAPLLIADGVSGVAATHWTLPDTGMQRENRQILQLYLPHLTRSLRIDHDLARMRNQAAASAFLMDRVPQAIVIIDAQGQLVRTNHKTELILSKADGLRVVDGRLKTVRTEESDRLQTLIAAAIKPGHSKRRVGMSVSRSTGDRPYTVVIEPLLGVDGVPAPGHSAAVIIISDAQDGPVLPWRALVDLFNLTRNEARLAARLGAGDSLKEAASELNISYRTAALHLEHLMHKTGTHRQSDLLRLLLLSPAILVEQVPPKVPAVR